MFATVLHFFLHKNNFMIGNHILCLTQNCKTVHRMEPPLILYYIPGYQAEKSADDEKIYVRDTTRDRIKMNQNLFPHESTTINEYKYGKTYTSYLIPGNLKHVLFDIIRTHQIPVYGANFLRFYHVSAGGKYDHDLDQSDKLYSKDLEGMNVI